VTTEEARQQYQKLNNKLCKVTQRAKEEWWAQKCEEIEELDKQGKQDQMYKAINDLNRKKSRSSISVKDENGKLISDPELVRNWWKEYIEKLYHAKGKPHSLSVEPATDIDDIGPCILEEEVATAIKELKNNKAQGIDEIPAELLKCMGNTAVKVFTRLCQKIYETGKWPADFLQTVIIPLEKKPNATECSDFSSISLLGPAAKVLIRVLTKRIEAKANAINHIGKDQFGFRKGKGTRDAITTLRVLGERSLQGGKDLCICFVDYEKAFDRVHWRKMMWMLKDIGVDWRDRNLIAKLYLGQRAVVRIDGELSGYCIIGQGVRQGCPLSPLSFNLYI